MGTRLKVIMVLACLFGLVLGWYGSATIAGPAIRVHLVFLRALAALVAGGSAGLAFMLWHTRKKRLLASAVVSLAAGAVVGIGLWMGAWPHP